LRDPRHWLGLVITLAAMWFALRGVALEAVWAEFPLRMGEFVRSW
jgi:hypothetical protein